MFGHVPNTWIVKYCMYMYENVYALLYVNIYIYTLHIGQEVSGCLGQTTHFGVGASPVVSWLFQPISIMLYIQVKSFAQVGVTIENHWNHQEKTKWTTKNIIPRWFKPWPFDSLFGGHDSPVKGSRFHHSKQVNPNDLPGVNPPAPPCPK